jgi:heterodisulfide reductase subunit C
MSALAADGENIRKTFVRRPGVTKAHNTHEPTLAETLHKATGTNVVECYQCGKCTAGCPMVRYMDLAPSQVMRLAQIGDAAALERLLASTAIWSCAGCLTCTQRCPQKQDPAAIMDALREMSYRRGRVSAKQKKVLAFHRAFLKMVEHTGRMSEVPLTGLYKMTSGDLFSDVTLAPAMMLRGKLPMLPKTIRHRKEMRRLFAACRRKGDR